jgi:hypothetical protein
MLNGYGQDKEIQKTYSWKYEAKDDVRFTFNNYNCDLIIHTWDKSEIEYKMSLDASFKSEDDADRMGSFIEGLDFIKSSGTVTFNNRFWKSRKSMNGRGSIELKGEKTIRYSKFRMKGELWIPKGCNLDLKSKYSGIELEDLDGKSSFKLYNDKLFGGNINGNIKIEAKYSTLELKNLKDIEAVLYNVDIEAGDIGSMKVSSKYSKFHAGNAGELDINAYNDKFSFGNTGDIKFIDKYSDLVTGESGSVEIDCYNSTIIASSMEDFELKSKYSKFKIDKVKDFNIINSYNDNFKIDLLNTLNITESKYSTYKLDEIVNSLSIGNGYSDKLTILKSGREFKGMKVAGKYLNIQMAIDKGLDYRFKANVNYPNFDINESSMNVKSKIKESSKLEMEAIKGTENESMPEIIINGYNISVRFTEIQ